MASGVKRGFDPRDWVPPLDWHEPADEAIAKFRLRYMGELTRILADEAAEKRIKQWLAG